MHCHAIRKFNIQKTFKEKRGRSIVKVWLKGYSGTGVMLGDRHGRQSCRKYNA